MVQWLIMFMLCWFIAGFITLQAEIIMDKLGIPETHRRQNDDQ